jgi:hypothetical protein
MHPALIATGWRASLGLAFFFAIGVPAFLVQTFVTDPISNARFRRLPDYEARMRRIAGYGEFPSYEGWKP